VSAIGELALARFIAIEQTAPDLVFCHVRADTSETFLRNVAGLERLIDGDDGFDPQEEWPMSPPLTPRDEPPKPFAIDDRVSHVRLVSAPFWTWTEQDHRRFREGRREKGGR
jgi:hypothetical protein